MDDLEYLYYRLDIPYRRDGQQHVEQHLFPFCDILEAEQIAYDLYAGGGKDQEPPDWVIDSDTFEPF